MCSSDLAALAPSQDVKTGELTRDDEGRHTTTASRAFELDANSWLIDSPGVRDFAPTLEHIEQTTLGFPEIARLAPACRFQDCRHLQEPNCAVQAAVAGGRLNARRYESYRRLRRLHDDFATARSARSHRSR